jgi:hypothetical protein
MRSESGTLGGALAGQVCVPNAGSVATQRLALGADLAAPPSKATVASRSARFASLRFDSCTLSFDDVFTGTRRSAE